MSREPVTDRDYIERDLDAAELAALQAVYSAGGFGVGNPVETLAVLGASALELAKVAAEETSHDTTSRIAGELQSAIRELPDVMRSTFATYLYRQGFGMTASTWPNAYPGQTFEVPVPPGAAS